MKKNICIITCVCMILLLVSLSLFAQGQKEKEEHITIEWWGEFTGFEAVGTENAVARYNETHPNVTIKYVGQPDLDKKVIASVMAGNPPAIVSVGNNQNYPQLVKGGVYMALDELLEKRNFSFEKYFEPWTSKAMKVDGKTYGLPCTSWVLALIYNKDMFREAGLDPENPPRTIEAFNEAQRKLTKRNANGDIIQTGLSFRTTFPGWFCAYYPYAFGATPEDLYDAKAKKFLKPEALYETWEWLQNMAKEFGAKDLQKFVAGFGDWGTEAEPFLSGKMAMSLNGPWIADHITKFAPNMDWGVASAPTVKDKVKDGDFAWIGIDTFSIPRGAKNVDASIDFMIWFSEKEGQWYMNTGEEGSGRCPTIVDFGGQEFYDACVANPKIDKFMDIMASPAVKPIPYGSPAEQAYNTEFSAILEPVLTLEIDAREAVDIAIERAQAALDKIK